MHENYQKHKQGQDASLARVEQEKDALQEVYGILPGRSTEGY